MLYGAKTSETHRKPIKFPTSASRGAQHRKGSKWDTQERNGSFQCSRSLSRRVCSCQQGQPMRSGAAMTGGAMTGTTRETASARFSSMGSGTASKAGAALHTRSAKRSDALGTEHRFTAVVSQCAIGGVRPVSRSTVASTPSRSLAHLAASRSDPTNPTGTGSIDPCTVTGTTKGRADVTGIAGSQDGTAQDARLEGSPSTSEA